RGGPCYPQRRVQFVNRSARLDSRMRFRHAAIEHQAGAALVSRFGHDAHRMASLSGFLFGGNAKNSTVPEFMKLLIGILALGFIFALALGSCCAAGSASHKLLEFGWDEPDTTFLRSHILQMQQSPFDGCVFHA